MYIDWTKHLKTPEAKLEFENSVVGAIDVLRRLKDIIADYEKALDRSETSISTYTLPNWAERQAHKNGNREAFHNIKTLIDIDQQRITNDPKLIG